MMMKKTLLSFLLLLAFLTSAANAAKPNILWITAEDMCPWMGCYGDKVNADATPNFDQLAKDGVLFSRAYVPAPVCSACRSSFILGAPGFRFNVHEHRSGRGDPQISLPKGIKTLPELLHAQGYTTFNFGKTDYNFTSGKDVTLYNLPGGSGKKSKGKGKGNDKSNQWTSIKNSQPFFGQIQTKGGKTNTGKFPQERKTDPAKVTIPGDYPDNEVYRTAVAQHHDTVRYEDDVVGGILNKLKENGLLENTIVVYFSDHGAPNLLRHKQFCTEGGLHVPLIISGPKPYVPGKGIVRKDLVTILDLTATTLAWAGAPKPKWVEGEDLFAKDYQPHEFVGAFVDRLDHTIGRTRTLRTDQFRYTRNYKLDRIHLQPQYRDGRPTTQNLHSLYKANQLSPTLRKIYFGERPTEELYDVEKDPAQLKNLVDDPAYAEELKRHRKLMDAWLAKGDHGAKEEPLGELRQQAKRWKAVNPEYEAIRTDSDGDGLSDDWEKINKRDPEDGRLCFLFDCGGWQTEGWKAKGIDNNIAGYLGFLDFTLGKESGTLERDGLKVEASKEDKALVVVLRSDKPLTLQLFANGKPLGKKLDAKAGKEWQTLRLPLAGSKVWSGTIESLGATFTGESAFVEVDTIEVER